MMNRLAFPSQDVSSFEATANLGAEDGYAEMGTRFKASHIKLLIFWLAIETQVFADENPSVPLANDLFSMELSTNRRI